MKRMSKRDARRIMQGLTQPLEPRVKPRQTLTRIVNALHRAGKLKAGLHLRIENGAYMPLVIEVPGDKGPDGHLMVSACHYGELNGDFMRDPEMCFQVCEVEGTMQLWPYYYRNDYMGVEQWSREIGDDGKVMINLALQGQHRGFFSIWERNLYQQGFWKAFEKLQGEQG